MKAKTEYKIISDTEKTTVENLVNNALQQGWDLHGTIQTSSIHGSGHTRYSQAMIKVKNKSSAGGPRRKN